MRIFRRGQEGAAATGSSEPGDAVMPPKGRRSVSASALTSRARSFAEAQDTLLPMPHAAAEKDIELPDPARLARTEELPALREIRDEKITLVLAEPGPPASDYHPVRPRVEPDLDSDVFLIRRKNTRDMPVVSAETLAAASAAAAEGVTLFVYGWENVQPGPLSWAFPSLRAALGAVRAMRNAIGWAIVTGRENSIDTARAKGCVLIEQS